jgi:hypothetical protein
MRLACCRRRLLSGTGPAAETCAAQRATGDESFATTTIDGKEYYLLPDVDSPLSNLIIARADNASSAKGKEPGAAAHFQRPPCLLVSDVPAASIALSTALLPACLPAAGNGTRGTNSSTAGGAATAASYYLWHQDLEFLSAGAMDQMLTRLSESPAVQRILKAAGVDLEVLLSMKPRLLAYWQQEAPVLMRLFRCAADSMLPAVSASDGDDGGKHSLFELGWLLRVLPRGSSGA